MGLNLLHKPNNWRVFWFSALVERIINKFNAMQGRKHQNVKFMMKVWRRMAYSIYFIILLFIYINGTLTIPINHFITRTPVIRGISGWTP